MDTQAPETMLEAARRFADPQVAHDYFVAIRWPNGVGCPRMGCGSMDVTFYPKHRRWYCKDCRHQFTAKVGTVFEDSPIGFDKWLPAMWLIASNRNGISSCELARALHVTQKTAWFMLHRIRQIMQNEAFVRLQGPVEADETFVGGKFRNLTMKHRRRLAGPSGRQPNPLASKTVVMGIVERGGEARAWVVPDTAKDTLQNKIAEHVTAGETVYTDAHPSYMGLRRGYNHYVINHAVEYVNGHVYTNTIEAFWSVFKRTIKGTYIAPRPWHLQRYVEEQVFRFNARKETDGERFPKALKRVEGVRLTYKALISKK